MNNIYDIISLMLLTTGIILITNKRALSYIRTFQVQSIIIIIGALFMVAHNHHIDLLIVSTIMLFLKVIYIPRYLRNTHHKVTHEIHKDFYLNIYTFLYFVYPYRDSVFNRFANTLDCR